MVAAGATGQVYEPDGMILGFISVINALIKRIMEGTGRTYW